MALAEIIDQNTTTTTVETLTEQSTLKTAINAALLAACKDTTRPALCGVLCELTRDTVRFTATDGFRLHTVEIAATSSITQGAGFIERAYLLDSNDLAAYAKTLSAKRAIYPAVNGAVLMFDPERLVTSSGHGIAYVDMQFPNWRQIVPSKLSGEFSVNADVFDNAIKICIAAGCDDLELTVDSDGKLMLEVPGEIVTSDSSAVNRDPCRFHCGTVMRHSIHDTGNVRLNPRYLRDAIKATATTGKCPLLTFRFNESKYSPIVFGSRFSGEQAIVMPIHRSQPR